MGYSWVFMTESYNDKNPIPPGTKFEMLECALHNSVVKPCRDLFDALEQMGKITNYSGIRLHCGDDRAHDYQRLNTYTEQFGVQIVEVVPHERLDPNHSATYLRSLAREGRKTEFKRLCGFVGEHKEEAYTIIRNYYGCI